jgi:hypothetical protein
MYQHQYKIYVVLSVLMQICFKYLNIFKIILKKSLLPMKLLVANKRKHSIQSKPLFSCA